MKEAIRMVPESIYDSEFPETSHFRSGRGCHSCDGPENYAFGALARRPRVGTSRRFLEFDIVKHIIDRHRLIPILKEEIDDPKFFYHTPKLLGAGRRKMNGHDSVPHDVLLSALPIGRIRHKDEIPMRIDRFSHDSRSRIDDQAVEEASFNAPQDNGDIFLGRVKSIQRKAAFHSLVSSWHTCPQAPPFAGDRKSGVATLRDLSLPLRRRSKAEFYGRERKNSAMRDRKITEGSWLIEPGGEARPIIELERLPYNSCESEKKRLRVKHRIHIAAYHLRSAIHSRFRNLGKSLPIKESTRGMSGRRSLSCAVQLARLLEQQESKSPSKQPREISFLHNSGSEQGSIGRSLTIGNECNDPCYHCILGRRRRKKGTSAGSFKDRIPHIDRGPYQKDTPKASGSRSH
ncbi:hypothetical protein MKW92_039712 [Papaver armeniacum]|nr:hypothetical protein MKW92_039712 [Papaver armeniacum]